MTRHRAHISLKTKLAAALCKMVRFDDAGRPVRVISYEESKRMSEDDILARFSWDHDPVPHAEGGPDEPWNLVPRPKEEHAEKTAKVDVPTIAKGKRLRASVAAFEEAMEAKAGRAEKPAAERRKGRAMPGTRESGFKRRLDGRVERRQEKEI